MLARIVRFVILLIAAIVLARIGRVVIAFLGTDGH